MDVVLHLHPAPEAPAPPSTPLAGLDHPLARAGAHRLHQGRPASPPPAAPSSSATALVVSADDRAKGLARLLARVREHLPEREFEFDPDDVGTQPLRFFVVEYLREAAFELLEDELPYAFTAEVEEFREAERPVYIRVTLFVERESQKGIVIGARRRAPSRRSAPTRGAGSRS